MYATQIFDYKNGHLCVLYADPMDSEPLMSLSWYPIVRGSRAEFEDIIGEEAKDYGSGLYFGKYRGVGYVTKFALEDGGSTRPIAFEQIPIPPPKVRKGVETRYRNGQWQKHLKNEGWVTA